MTTPHQQAVYLQEVAELRKMFPDVDFVNEWILWDVQGWADYEEGATYWLFLHEPTNTLHQLSDIHCVMVPYRPLQWSDLFQTSLEEWLLVILEVEKLNGHQE